MEWVAARATAAAGGGACKAVEEEVRAEEKDKQHARERVARNEAKAANKFKHQHFCIVCRKSDGCVACIDDERAHTFETPELVCVRCPTRMHLDCTPGWSVVTIKQDGPGGKKQVSGGWICPHHRCKTCWRTAHEAGGLLFRCVDCPTSLCEECLPDGFEPVASASYFGKLNYQLPRSFETIRCAKCAQTVRLICCCSICVVCIFYLIFNKFTSDAASARRR